MRHRALLTCCALLLSGASPPSKGDAGTPPTDDREDAVRRRRAALDTIDRAGQEWDQAVQQGRNNRDVLCASVRTLRFPTKGLDRPLTVRVPATLADGGVDGELELVIRPDGTVESCR